MVNIAICKLDGRGRLCVPLSFLKANGVLVDEKEWYAVIKPRINKFTEVTVEFVADGDVIHGDGSSKDYSK